MPKVIKRLVSERRSIPSSLSTILTWARLKLLHLFGFQSVPVRVAPTGGRFFCGPKNYQLKNNVFFGPEPNITFLSQRVQKDDLFLDIGANIGLYTILVSRATGCQTIAFEPNTHTYCALVGNVGQNRSDFIKVPITLNLALSDGERLVDITNRHHGGTNYLKPSSESTDNGSLLGQEETIRTMSVSLDWLEDVNFIANIQFRRIVIKIDVERHERRLILGASKFFFALNQSAVPVMMLIEGFRDEVEPLVRELGFSLQEQLASGDMVFTNKLGLRQLDWPRLIGTLA